MPHFAIFTLPAADLPSSKGQPRGDFATASDPNLIRVRPELHLENRQSVPATRCTTMAALAAGLALSACATATPSADNPSIASAAAPNTAAASSAAASSAARRDLGPEEKKAIVAAVAPSLRDPSSAKYRWTKLSTVPADDGSYNYCSTVDAKSPYAPYDGKQAYIVEVKLSLGKVTAAVMGLITGGKDVAIVSKMCAKYGLDPNSAT
jgi:hypothetical protein